jgi:mannose-6-phosphate isomerase-like protein (cupin superfamily)
MGMSDGEGFATSNKPSPSSEPHGPINLTQVAEGMSWTDARESLRVCSSSQTDSLCIQPLDESDGQLNDGVSDAIYIVIAGYGVLQCGSKEIEYTAGDVLFIPRGHPHRFGRMDGALRIWRISLAEDADKGP